MPGVDNGDDEPLQLRSRGPLGSPESAAYFRAALEELGQTTTTFAQIMKRKGDDREPAVIRQHLRRMATMLKPPRLGSGRRRS